MTRSWASWGCFHFFFAGKRKETLRKTRSYLRSRRPSPRLVLLGACIRAE